MPRRIFFFFFCLFILFMGHFKGANDISSTKTNSSLRNRYYYMENHQDFIYKSLLFNLVMVYYLVKILNKDYNFMI